MRFYSDLPIRRKVLLLVGSACALTLMISLTAFVVNDYFMLRAITVEQLTSVANMVTTQVADAMSADQPEAAEKILAKLADQPSIEYACLFGKEGHLFADFLAHDHPGYPPPPPKRLKPDFVPAGCVNIVVPVVHNGQTIGTLLLHDSMTNLRKHRHRYAIFAAFIALLTLTVTLLFSAQLQRAISVPIVKLTKTAESIVQQNDFSLRMAPQSSDEIGSMYKQFNQMLDRIEEGRLALEKSEQRFRDLVEQAADALFVHDIDSRVVDVNKQACDSLGYSREELLSLTIEDIDPWFCETHDKSEFWSNLVPQCPVTFESRHRRKDGTTFPVEIRLGVIETGGQYLVHALARDITERIRSRKQLDELRSLLKSIIDSMPSILVGVDPDSRVMLWNREAERFTEISAENALGRRLDELVPSFFEYVPEVETAIQNQKMFGRQKVQSQHHDQVRFSDVTVYPLLADGVNGVVIRVDDVTDRVHMEELVIQSEKMMSVGGLAAGMAHEINNPLAGMLQNAQVLLSRVSPELPINHEVAVECGTTMEAVARFMRHRGIVEMLQAIHASGQRAAEIVDNMLSFSRQSHSELVEQDLGELLDTTVALARNDYDLKKKYDFRQIEIVRNYDSNLPKVPCIKTKMEQVILNLLKNAAHILIAQLNEGRPARIALRTYRRGGNAVIEVEDNGPGMSEGTRKRIFEPFFTTKETGMGTGLGLSISYFIVTENHGGTMSVESIPGKNTTFVISLPIAARGQL